MSPNAKKILRPLLIVDGIFFAALAIWLVHRSHSASPPERTGTPVIQTDTRHLEAKLTEIGLINKGNAPGRLDETVSVTWQEADLVQAKGLSGFDERDTGRYGEQFIPTAALHGTVLAANERRAIGWIKLTDDVPVHADIATTQP